MARKHRAIEPSGYTIALVDDDPDYLEATRLLLESEGHTVLTAIDGGDALQLLQKKSVDLLLLDYFMPKMTGEQVVEQLRKFDAVTQVILQTGYANERPPREMLRELMEDNKNMAAAMRKAHKLADDHEDSGTAGLLETFKYSECRRR